MNLYWAWSPWFQILHNSVGRSTATKMQGLGLRTGTVNLTPLLNNPSKAPYSFLSFQNPLPSGSPHFSGLLLYHSPLGFQGFSTLTNFFPLYDFCIYYSFALPSSAPSHHTASAQKSLPRSIFPDSKSNSPTVSYCVYLLVYCDYMFICMNALFLHGNGFL